jgi:hypothetical protein
MYRSLSLLALALCIAFSFTACGKTAPGAAPSAPAAAPANPVKVSLSWDKPVDMDLEIWTADGTRLINRAFPGENWPATNCGQDVKTGGTPEYFTFVKVGETDFSKGEYVVSIYFAGRDDASISEALATVTVTKADGSTEVRTRKIQWEQGQDQWHGFKIDAATGRIIEDLDKFITIQTTPAAN